MTKNIETFGTKACSSGNQKLQIGQGFVQSMIHRSVQFNWFKRHRIEASVLTSHSKQYDFSSCIQRRFSSRVVTTLSTRPRNNNTADNDQSFHRDKHLIFIEQLIDFLAKAKSNTTLQEKLNSAQSPEEVVSITNDSGHERTADKLNKLNSGELEHISGRDTQGNTFHPEAWLAS